MRFLKSVFNFYLECSIHVSLAVVAFTITTYVEFQIPIEKSILAFVFLGTITGYNFIKYAGIAGLHHKSLAKNLKLIQLFSLLCFGLFVYTLFHISRNVIYTSLVFGILTILYVLPFYQKKNLRNFEGLKIFIVAFVWAGVTVLLPWIGSENTWNTDIILSFFQRFLWVLVLIIPFEIRDLVYDDASLGTLPQKLGIRKTKRVGFVILVGVLILEGFKDEINTLFFVSFLFAIITTAVLLANTKKNQPGFFSSFWVEGIPLYWIGFWFLLQYYFFIS